MSRVENYLALPPPSSSIVAVAISGKKKSKLIVGWALDKFAVEGNVLFKLLHVRPKITSVPTPMGNVIPISEVRDDVAAAYKQEIEWQTNELIQPYKKMCDKRKVTAEVLVVEADDLVAAIIEEITRNSINRLVIGTSSHSFFSRKHGMCSSISASTPSFCTVYAVSKGKLSSVKPCDSDANATIRDDGSERTTYTTTSSESADVNSSAPYSHLRARSVTMQGAQPLAIARISSSVMETSSVGSHETRRMSTDVEEMKDAVSCDRCSSDNGHTVNWISRLGDFEERKDARSSCSSNKDYGRSSWTSMVTDNHSRASHQASNMSDSLSEYSFTENQANLTFEIEKLRAELRHVQDMYQMAQTETMDASRKLHELNQRRLIEAIKLEELKLKEQEAKELAAIEKQKFEEARREVASAKQRAESEASQRREAERRSAHDVKEKEKLENALTGPGLQYQHFTWEEIVAATSSFSEELKVGTGTNATVYRCNLHHTTTAVKVLHSVENGLSKPFQKELEILSKIRHPHLVLLLGACPEQGCLVYEYMANGSLEERLLQVNNSAPIPWFERFRIAWEVASALVFLHRSKPKPIIHRDLRPANVLLDHNFVSKVGDVGLSTMIQADPFSNLTICKDTSLVGTLCYIDPEYQRTGMISPKSDVYSFGMVILQLLTAKPAITLTHSLERAIDNEGNFVEVLDPMAGNWPIDETRELAELGLCCTELRRKDRPNLGDQIIPILERLKKVADRARNSLLGSPSAPPSHFICPLLKDVMSEPCVAADGYTYDRQAIEEWLEEHHTSPMTNQPLSSKSLMPNYTLYAAITEWRSRKQ